jgi:hypothetical protein
VTLFSSNDEIPIPADGILFDVIESIKALQNCPPEEMNKWSEHWIEQKYIPVSYEKIMRKFKK